MGMDVHRNVLLNQNINALMVQLHIDQSVCTQGKILRLHMTPWIRFKIKIEL